MAGTAFIGSSGLTDGLETLEDFGKAIADGTYVTIEAMLAEEIEEDGGFYGFEKIIVSTVDDYGYADSWYFTLNDITEADEFFEDLDDGEVGIMVETSQDDDGNGLYSYHAVFEHDEPTFSDGTWNNEYRFESVPTLADEEETALADLYGWTSYSYTVDHLDAIMGSIAEEIVSSMATPSNPLNKIKSPEINEDMFDIFEEEEAAQTVVVSTTYDATTAESEGY